MCATSWCDPFLLFYCNKKTYTVHNISTGTIHYVYTNTLQDIHNTLDIHKVIKRKGNTIHIRQQFSSCVPAPSKPSNIFRKDCYSKAHKNLI